MVYPVNRRQMLASSGACLGAAVAATAAVGGPAPAESAKQTFRFALNMGTIRGQKLPVPKQVEAAAEAGYDGIEPWVGDVQKYVESGGSLADLRKQIADSGMEVVGAIGFARWIVDDDRQRADGVEQLKREMDLIARIGGRWIAAPPAGANREPGLELRKAAERYRAILQAGEQVGVTPQLEIWGSSQNLSRIGEAAFVASEAGHPRACLLLDAYHIYKGGSSFEGLRILSGAAMHCFHINDYPADPPRETINDSHRVYPGDGVAPLAAILRTLHDTGFRGYLSLELFNRDYWKQDALEVARTGLAKCRAAADKAMG